MLPRNSLINSLISFLSAMMLLPLMYDVQAQQEFPTYEDPQGRFTIQYAPDWEPHPAENRFATAEVELLKADTSLGQLVDLFVQIIPDIEEEVV
jgi:hypothetical protein